jgi:hypothetical protein
MKSHILYINSLRLSVTEFGSIRPTGRSIARRGGCRAGSVTNSLRLSVTELGSVRPTGLGPALSGGQSPAVGGAGPGPSQKGFVTDSRGGCRARYI